MASSLTCVTGVRKEPLRSGLPVSSRLAGGSHHVLDVAAWVALRPLVQLFAPPLGLRFRARLMDETPEAGWALIFDAGWDGTFLRRLFSRNGCRNVGEMVVR
jgi:hypothetical protein